MANLENTNPSFKEVQNLMASHTFLQNNPFETSDGKFESNLEQIFINICKKVTEVLSVGFTGPDASYLEPKFTVNNQEYRLKVYSGYTNFKNIKRIDDNQACLKYFNTSFTIAESFSNSNSKKFKSVINITGSQNRSSFFSHSLEGGFVRVPDEKSTDSALYFDKHPFKTKLEYIKKYIAPDMHRDYENIPLSDIAQDPSAYLCTVDLTKFEKDRQLWNAAKKAVREELIRLNLPCVID